MTNLEFLQGLVAEYVEDSSRRTGYAPDWMRPDAGAGRHPGETPAIPAPDTCLPLAGIGVVAFEGNQLILPVAVEVFEGNVLVGAVEVRGLPHGFGGAADHVENEQVASYVSVVPVNPEWPVPAKTPRLPH